ncbi:hypothetical protein EDB80DRAFT_686433 [Ilyonectria destructans]|nr:hypothetical protein EDB80DRAFT_686433 [Ilyonectria destructans]
MAYSSNKRRTAGNGAASGNASTAASSKDAALRLDLVDQSMVRGGGEWRGTGDGLDEAEGNGGSRRAPIANNWQTGARLIQAMRCDTGVYRRPGLWLWTRCAHSPTHIPACLQTDQRSGEWIDRAELRESEAQDKTTGWKTAESGRADTGRGCALAVGSESSLTALPVPNGGPLRSSRRARAYRIGHGAPTGAHAHWPAYPAHMGGARPDSSVTPRPGRVGQGRPLRPEWPGPGPHFSPRVRTARSGTAPRGVRDPAGCPFFLSTSAISEQRAATSATEKQRHASSRLRTKHSYARADTPALKARRHSDPAQPAQHHDVHSTVPGSGSHPPCHGAAATPPPPSKGPLSPPAPCCVGSLARRLAGLDWVCRSSAESVHSSVCLLAGLSAWSDGPWSRLLPQKSGLGFVTFCAVRSTGERNCMPGARRGRYARHTRHAQDWAVSFGDRTGVGES